MTQPIIDNSTYYKLSILNKTDELIPLKFKYNGSFEISPDNINLLKFNINSQSYPVYLPNIVKSSDLNLLKFNEIGKVYTEDVYMENKGNPNYYLDSTDYLTDLAITIVKPASMSNRYEYITYPVKWIPQKNTEMKPLAFPTEAQVLNNRYFYCYDSIHLIYCLQSTIRTILMGFGIAEEHIKIVKTNDTYQIMKEKNNSGLRIFFNYNLANLFKFYYRDEFIHYFNNNDTQRYQEVIINNNITTEIGNKEYYVAETLALKCQMFPFRELIFTSSRGVTARQIIVNNENQLNDSKPIIFSLTLNPDDVDKIAGNINYAATTAFRKSVIESSFTDFELEVYLVKSNGLQLQIMLDTDDDADMLLEFT